MSAWEFVKARTAADGAVWRSEDGLLDKRTGDALVLDEARRLQELGRLGYPVPEVVDVGGQDRTHYFIERSVGSASLHDRAVAESEQAGAVSEELLATASAVSVRLLAAQACHPCPVGNPSQEWFERAGFAENVLAENPELDSPRVRAAMTHASARLGAVPMCRSHLDYGLPNVFPSGVIDWQHHGLAPVGYDVYPMLEIVPFKGGTKGYRFTADQRTGYLSRLDQAAVEAVGQPLSVFLGEFLLVKCFFFLALMRPNETSRPDKHAKWRYRRALFQRGLEQYESSGAIHTDTFPTLAAFTERLARTAADGP